MSGQVIACVDVQSPLQALCDGAAWAAQGLSAPLLLLQVLERHPETAQHLDATGQIGLGAQEDLLEELVQLDQRRSALAQEQGRQVLEGMRTRAQAAGVPQVDRLQRHGELLETLGEVGADASLVVMGRHDHRLWAGHAPDHHIERVLRGHRRSVLMVPGQQFVAPSSFVLALGDGEDAASLLQRVSDHALLRGLRCHLVRAGEHSLAHEVQMQQAAVHLRGAGLTVDVTLAPGDVDAVVMGTVDRLGAQLLVMGAHGHSRLRQLVLGSTTTVLLRGSQVPVLVLSR